MSYETRLHQSNLLHELLVLCTTTQSELKDWISIELFLQNIRTLCPNKGDISMVKLEKFLLLAPRQKTKRMVDSNKDNKKASDKDIRLQLINFKDFLYDGDNEVHLKESSNSNNSHSAAVLLPENRFIEAFRNQHMDECILFWDRLEANISKRCNERVISKDGKLDEYIYVYLPYLCHYYCCCIYVGLEDPTVFLCYIHKLREAIQVTDPHKPRDDINVYLARGCGLSIEEMLLFEGKKTPVDLIEFKKRIRHGLLVESSESVDERTSVRSTNRLNSAVFSQSKLTNPSMMLKPTSATHLQVNGGSTTQLPQGSLHQVSPMSSPHTASSAISKLNSSSTKAHF
jgi:hypothetical protein